MAQHSAHSDVDRVLDAIDLVHLIGEHIALKRSGREHVGLCPFHDDRTPSMHVVTHKGNHFYKCFACGASGNAITFVMEYHKMPFVDALRFLAERAGIELTRRSASDAAGIDAERTSRSDLIRANEIALEYFRSVLAHEEAGRRARQALESRGINSAMVEAFQIGASPDHPEALLAFARKRGYDLRALHEAGLLKERSGGGMRDAFIDRLIFPICDQLGRPIAFGGRVLKADDVPKYLNSAESRVFDKSRTLFGLHLARRAIDSSGTAIVCEGYTDVIAMHQAGLDNAVATLGTAFSREHARTLERLCDRIILLFDGDEAGRRAADRAIDIFVADAVRAFLTQTVDVKICMLPDGCDPDELLRTGDAGRSTMQQLLATAVDALPFMVKRFQQTLGTADTLSGRQKLMEALLARLADLGFNEMSGIRKRLVLPTLADLLGVGIRDIEDAIPKRRPKRMAEPVADADIEQSQTELIGAHVEYVPRGRRVAEEHFLSVLLFDPSVHTESVDAGDGHLLPVLEAVTPAMFIDPACRTLYEAMYESLEAHGTLSVAKLQQSVGHGEPSRRIAELYFRGASICDHDESNAAAACRRSVAALNAAVDRNELKRVMAEIRAGTGETTVGESALRRALDHRRAAGDDLAARPSGVRGKAPPQVGQAAP